MLFRISLHDSEKDRHKHTAVHELCFKSIVVDSLNLKGTQGSEFSSILKSVVDISYLDSTGTLPGIFALGPKLHFLNIQRDPDPVLEQ